MKYLVMEIQTAADGSVANLVYSFDSQASAESKYHSVLAAAAISSLPVHACVLMQSDGRQIDRKAYKHEQAATE